MADFPSRRDFLAAGAVAAGAAALGTSRPAAAGEFTGKLRLAVKYGMFKTSDSPEAKLRILKEIGYDGVEPSVKERVAPEILLNASQTAGLPIHGVVLGSVEDIPAAVDRAVMFGATSVLIVAGRVDENMPYAKNYDLTQEAVAKAIPYAAEKKIPLLLENVWNNFLLSPLEMARYLDELNSEWVAAYFDIGNVVRFAWPEHWIAVLGPRIKKIDIKEYSRDKQLNEGLWKGFNVKIGEGSINWPAVRHELKNIHYSGWATAEVDGGDRTELEDIYRRMRDVLDV